MKHARKSLEDIATKSSDDIKTRAHQNALMLVDEIDTNIHNRALAGETYYYLHIHHGINTYSSEIYDNKYDVGAREMHDAIVELYKESGLTDILQCGHTIVGFEWQKKPETITETLTVAEIEALPSSDHRSPKNHKWGAEAKLRLDELKEQEAKDNDN